MNREQSQKVALDYFQGYPLSNDVIITTDGQAFHTKDASAARIHQERLGGSSFRISRKEVEESKEVEALAGFASDEVKQQLMVLQTMGMPEPIVTKFQKAGKVDPAILTEKQKETYDAVKAKWEAEAEKLKSGIGTQTGTNTTTNPE